MLPNDQPSALTVSVLRTVPELGAHQNLAVSIWAPRAHPTTRFSARLRFYNKAFLALCDTHSFGGGNFGEVYPTAVLCYSSATAANIQTHLSRSVSVVDALHSGEERGSVPCFSHISKLGRLTVVDLEVYAIRTANNLAAFLVTERRRAPDMPLPLALYPSPLPMPESSALAFPRSVSASPQLEIREDDDECEAPRPHSMEGGFKASQRQDGEWVWVASPKRHLSGSKADENFLCMQCGTKETSQKRCDHDIPSKYSKTPDISFRRGPQGPNTLCNRCGLQWIRLMRRASLDSLKLSRGADELD